MKQARPKATRNLSSPDLQAEVVAQFLTSGKSIAEIAHELNLPEPTVRDWVRRASVEAVSTKVPAEDWTQAELETQLAAAAEAVGLAEAKADKAEKALARAKTKAAKAVAHAEVSAAEAVAHAESAAASAVAQAAKRFEALLAQAEAVAREKAEAASLAEAAASDAQARFEIAGAEALALREAVARSEALAVEAAAVAQAEVAAREQTEAAARAEIAAAYAAAVEAVLRVEVAAGEQVAQAEAAAAEKVARAEAFAAGAVAKLRMGGPEVASGEPPKAHAARRAEAKRVEALAPAEIVGWADAGAAGQAEVDPEAVARAEIAELVSRLEPVEVWVHAVGRTVSEARRAALDTLGVEEAEAEFEILSKGRLISGRVRVRARIRLHEAIS